MVRITGQAIKVQWNLDLETLGLEHSFDLEELLLSETNSGFMIKIHLDLVHSLDLETSTTATETGF